METGRERARRELVAEIKQAARRQVAEVGAAALSLRAVARELGLASSALYRYFPSRDALLTALIMDAYDDLGAVAEAAALRSRRARPGARWLQVCRACRTWALAHPHEFALIYGSPVPGYSAPQDTVGPATRVTTLMASVVVEALAAGELDRPRQPVPGLPLVTAATRSAVGADLDRDHADLVERTLVLWVVLMGTISFELFGHLHGVVLDGPAWFDASIAVAAEGVGLRVPMGLRR